MYPKTQLFPKISPVIHRLSVQRVKLDILVIELYLISFQYENHHIETPKR